MMKSKASGAKSLRMRSRESVWMVENREKKRAVLVLMIPRKKAVGLPMLRAYDSGKTILSLNGDLFTMDDK